ncbi:Nramp family divalent metal transporter [Streptomyces sp. NPDC052052]|uniref:Nramp family divalent metal transporter n=1 Tax=Streptomyces sp. NPDC052052 TaxID=3154756 RepID=UPI003424B74A
MPTGRLRQRFRLLGPAFVAAVAYVDPGNVATNVTAGAKHGYALVWVVVLANAMAVIVQYLSAKLGLVTGRSLAGELGLRLPRPLRVVYWIQAEAVVVATDLAEVVGGAVALHLLFTLPLLLGALLTVAVSLVVLRVEDTRGQTALEHVIMSFLGLMAVGFVAGLFVGPPDPGDLVRGLTPSLTGNGSVLLASGIIGATVMPHVIYLHSSLTVGRLEQRGAGLPTRALLSATRADVVAALCVAGLLNLSLLVVAAANLRGASGTDTLQGVHRVIVSELGPGVAMLFAVALLGSGLASTAVGNTAGAEVMRGLIHRRVPRIARRVVTAVPALVVLAGGTEPSKALVLSQVVLSLGIPFALIPLLVLTSRRDVMGPHVNRWGTTAAAGCVAGLVVALNATLVCLTVRG